MFAFNGALTDNQHIFGMFRALAKTQPKTTINNKPC